MAKVSDVDGLTPKAMDVGGETVEGGESSDGESSGGVRLKKELSLLNGVAIIVGVIVGSGIFVSPRYALKYAGSKGMALIVWVLSGILSMSGGDYAYLGEAFGSLPSFLYLWVALFILDSFTAAKMLALLITFFASLWYLFSGHTENLQNMMQGTKTDPGELAIAFYTGLFSYSGWNYLNFVTEELKDPYKNLPRAICISMPVVTLVYLLTNIAYFAVLTDVEIHASEAVAVTFSEKILGVMAWIMPLFVALCTFGSLNGAIYTSSRLFFCLVTLLLLMSNSVESLIVYVTSVEALFTICSVAGLLWMRHTRASLQRPIRVSLVLPITFLVICTVLVIFSCFTHPMEVGVGIIFILIGVPVYGVFIKWDNKPLWLRNACNSFNLTCSKMFMCVPEETKEL
ncbi:Large neutral amino acids transporter small subunit 2 [Operophtera brumata]|uniref:Large neutral amino acids transporter small subunit 2 n=1 Tax=Operophtera brumata TaxID=104452 RepID=A0A0L7LV70_OPEBR|nr:Large neutral amino acids transporter small subunit 2 [Operophtera brumata]